MCIRDSLGELLDVDVQADDLCPRYTARMVRNVKIAPSPKWMRQRLRSAGIRPINNIVDITNYVMVEYGQPMHAFDYRYVKGGKIVVRRAGEDKTLTTLDGNVRALQPDMLVIADETKPPTSSAPPSERRRWRSACARTPRPSLKRTLTRC